MTSFADNFWGEKNNGFDVLYHNMKHGQDSSKEFSDFLRESCTAEEAYARSLQKIANNASKYGTKGSFSPYWQTLKSLVEKLTNLHFQLVYTWQDLMKDVQRYTDEQHKKHKAMKDSESATLETVQNIQQTITATQKAKEVYHARCSEYEKLNRDNSASTKDIEKAETKFKKARDDYQGLVEKYANVRNDFETRMLDSSKKFQEVEEYHLGHMKDFVDTYSKAWEHQYVLLGQVHQEFRNGTADLSVQRLIETFVKSKTTGTEKPGAIEFVEADLSSLPALGSTPDLEKKDIPVLDKPKKEGGDHDGAGKGAMEGGGAPVLAKLDPPPAAATTAAITKSTSSSLLDGMLPRNAGWFLSKRRKEKKKKKKKTESPKENSSQAEKDSPKVDDEGFTIDEEGYRIRPNNDSQGDRDSWYSSSDSDSDGEEKRKIKVEIKPLSSPNGVETNNVQDLTKAIGGLRLSPTAARRATPTNEMKKSISLSDSLNGNGVAKPPSQDLLGLDLFGSGSVFSPPPTTTTANNTSTPTGSIASVGINAHDSTAELGSLAAAFPSIAPSTSSITSSTGRPPRSHTPTNTPPLLSGPPGPGTRARPLPSVATARPTGRQSPALSQQQQQQASPQPLSERTDSVPSLNSFHMAAAGGGGGGSVVSFGSSRGPSPLTLGMSDTIPLAVSYSEKLNALFKGNDTAKCRVKMTGEMVISFPAGIVRVLAENPNPAMLTFRLKNTSNIHNILVNKQILQEDTSVSGADSRVYNFDMSMLTEHLRRQTDQNKSASYFNIDILKYEIKSQAGALSVPLQMTSYWKCEASVTNFRLDYSYNPQACTRNPVPLQNLSIIVPVDGGVKDMVAKPSATWQGDSSRAVWRLGELSEHSGDDQRGHGSLRAKFEVSAGPSHPSQAAAQFLCEGHTLSGVDFELLGAGYRVSLVKKRFITGKYISEAEQTVFV